MIHQRSNPNIILSSCIYISILIYCTILKHDTLYYILNTLITISIYYFFTTTTTTVLYFKKLQYKEYGTSILCIISIYTLNKNLMIYKIGLYSIWSTMFLCFLKENSKKKKKKKKKRRSFIISDYNYNKSI